MILVSTKPCGRQRHLTADTVVDHDDAFKERSTQQRTMLLPTIRQRNPGEWTILIELKRGDTDSSKIDGVRLGSVRTGYFDGIDDG